GPAAVGLDAADRHVQRAARRDQHVGVEDPVLLRPDQLLAVHQEHERVQVVLHAQVRHAAGGADLGHLNERQRVGVEQPVRRLVACYTLNALTALSLLLCVAILALWVRSYVADDHVGEWRVRVFRGGAATERRAGIFSSRGRLAAAVASDTFPNCGYAPTPANT